MYEFMKETLVTTGFLFIIMLGIWGIGYRIATFVRWAKKKLRKADGKPAGTETEVAAE